jgi:hypothetical protein
MADVDKARADKLLDRIEMLVGEFPQRDGANAVLLAEILEAVHGLRSLLGVVEAH